MQAIGFNLIPAHAKRWLELSQQAMDGIGRYFPNAEETQHVVNTIGIKVL